MPDNYQNWFSRIFPSLQFTRFWSRCANPPIIDKKELLKITGNSTKGSTNKNTKSDANK